jgi:hypothetical protein
VYMEKNAGDSERPDLFDVRFVEGELLYYARDESVAVRRKRTMVLVFDPSLVRARVLDVRESRQRLVWLLGCATAMVRRLSQWLDTEAVRFELLFANEEAESPLREEQDVLALALREFRARGQLVLASAESSLAAAMRAREAHGARARILLFGAGLPPAALALWGLDGIVDAAAPVPRVLWPEGGPADLGPADDAVEVWAAATRQLLDGLLRRRRARAA